MNDFKTFSEYCREKGMEIDDRVANDHLTEAHLSRGDATSVVLSALGLSDETLDSERDHGQIEAAASMQLSGFEPKKVQALAQLPDIQNATQSNPTLRNLLSLADQNATVGDLIQALSTPAGEEEPSPEPSDIYQDRDADADQDDDADQDADADQDEDDREDASDEFAEPL